MGDVYRFGPFALDVVERTLVRDSEPVPLAGKAFDTLVVLVEGAGKLQTQATLMDRLWPDVVVEQNNLQYNVSLVRRALGSEAGVEIVTVRGQGYRLEADVTRAATGPGGAAVSSAAVPPVSRGLPPQKTFFCRAHDGERLAYARMGTGPSLVKAANWLSHVELDAQTPVWPHWLSLMSCGREVVRYDARGNGLSEASPVSVTFEDFVCDLGSVFDAAGIERAPLLGISQGAAVAVAYAARHPERVSALVLFGGCARGWRVKGHRALQEHFEALMVLMKQGWGRESPAFRQIFTTAFFPDATREEAEAFNELQRETASPESAARILSALGDLDVRELLGDVQVPTLALHCRGDDVVPFDDGIELASGIAGARFVPIESDSHLPLEREPAWRRIEGEIDAFLREISAAD